jgi:hypothetical protein
MTIVDKWGEAILLHDVGPNVFRWDAHIFEAIHWCADVKKFGMLVVSIFTFGMDTVLLRKILLVSKLAVGVLTSPL